MLKLRASAFSLFLARRWKNLQGQALSQATLAKPSSEW
ncbi:hypothetical protein RV02_GL002873 [Enterococcus gilvus]|nr:hypothetical protein RV02_GL002873 [Enterococcus gilvus]